MKLKFDIEIMEIDDRSVAVPVGDGAEGFHGIMKVNKSAAFILNLLKEETTEEAIVGEVLQNFSGQRETVEGYVREYIETLRGAGILI